MERLKPLLSLNAVEGEVQAAYLSDFVCLYFPLPAARSVRGTRALTPQVIS